MQKMNTNENVVIISNVSTPKLLVGFDEMWNAGFAVKIVT
jgi:hypothetical protein